MDLVFYATNILFFKIIYLHTPTLGGLTQEQAMIFVGSYLVSSAIDMTILSNNMWWLPIFVKKGDLDYYLTRPVSSRFFLSFRDIAANSFINFLFAFAILIWAFWNYQGEIVPLNFFIYVIFIFLGLYVLYNIRLLFIIPVFWIHSSRGFDEIYFGLKHTMERPHQIYTGLFSSFITSLIPFALVISFPVHFLFHVPDFEQIIHILLVTAFLTILVHFFWSKALKNYSSASS